MVNYVLLARHGERSDYQNPNLYTQKQMKKIQDRWFNSTRYKENPYDPFITNLGEEENKKLIQSMKNELLKFKKVVLYSSPFTRCIMSAGNMQTQLKKYGYDTPIHVEYGLSEPITLQEMLIYDKQYNLFEYKQINDTKLLSGKGKNNDIILDEKMKLDNIYDRFPQYKFQKDYNPLFSYTPKIIENNSQYALRLAYTIDEIIKQNPDTFIIIVAHADMVRYMYNYYIGQLDEDMYNYVYGDQGFSSSFLFKKDNNDIQLLTFKKGNMKNNKNEKNYSYLIILLLILIILICKFK